MKSKSSLFKRSKGEGYGLFANILDILRSK